MCFNFSFSCQRTFLVAGRRDLLFGDVVEGVMRLNKPGRAADRYWNEIPRHFPRVEIDEYVVMPNHVHGIIHIVDQPYRNTLPIARAVGVPNFNPRGTSRTIGSMVRGFKIGVTRWFRAQGWIGPVWQRNYHDHIIRHERSLDRIRACIRANPANWRRDRQNPDWPSSS